MKLHTFISKPTECLFCPVTNGPLYYGDGNALISQLLLMQNTFGTQIASRLRDFSSLAALPFSPCPRLAITNGNAVVDQNAVHRDWPSHLHRLFLSFSPRSWSWPLAFTITFCRAPTWAPGHLVLIWRQKHDNYNTMACLYVMLSGTWPVLRLPLLYNML